jgi:predicted tellurium resistance membrane protein TerC
MGVWSFLGTLAAIASGVIDRNRKQVLFLGLLYGPLVFLFILACTIYELLGD